MIRNLTALLVVALGSSVAVAQADTDLLPANRPIEQAIDHYIDAKLKADKVAAVPSADDAAILRRLTLDLNGRVPTVGEMQEYVASSDPDKKAKLVDRLMASSAFSATTRSRSSPSCNTRTASAARGIRETRYTTIF